MGIEDQLAFIDSLLWNIQGVLENLGKPDATFREPAVHAFLHQRRITRVPRTAFRAYERPELQRAIALLSRIHTNYKVQWRKLCEQNAQERDERRRREKLLREECYSWDAMLAWMKEHAHGQKPAELFTFEGAIGRENYFRLRAQAIRLYTLREAEDFVATHNTLNTPIGVLDAFDVVAMPEFGGTYYAPRFTTTIRHGY